MADEIILYTHPMSRGRIARWMLEEVGARYRAEVLDFGAMKSPDYLAINPMGKVPAIVHRGAVVTECPAICAYLADAFPNAGLAPPHGDIERAPYYRWLFFAAGPLEAAAVNKALGVDVPPDKKGMVGYGSLAEVIDALDGAVSAREFICGARFTAADVYVSSHLMWGMQFGTLEKRPAFVAYWERLADRPELRKAAAIDDALVAGANRTRTS